MTAINKFPCPVCGYLYDTPLQAQQCVETNGTPAKPKYKIGTIVKLNNTEVKVIKTCYVSPDWMSRKQAHLLIYLVRFRNNLVTTVTEEELSPR